MAGSARKIAAWRLEVGKDLEGRTPSGTQQSLPLMDWVGTYQLGIHLGKAGPWQNRECPRASGAAVVVPDEGLCLDSQRLGSKSSE